MPDTATTPWEFVQDDTDAAMGTARVLNARNELVCTTTPENADLIVCAVNYSAVDPSAVHILPTTASPALRDANLRGLLQRAADALHDAGWIMEGAETEPPLPPPITLVLPQTKRVEAEIRQVLDAT